MAIVGTMGTARSKGECVTHAKSLILKVVGSQQLASIFCRKLLLAPPKPQNFPAARAQGGGLRPGSATLTATIIHAGPHTPSMSRGETRADQAPGSTPTLILVCTFANGPASFRARHMATQARAAYKRGAAGIDYPTNWPRGAAVALQAALMAAPQGHAAACAREDKRSLPFDP